MNALEYSAKVRPGSRVPWPLLERAAFSGRPDVLGSKGGKSRPAKIEYLWLIPAVIAVAFFAISPLIGFVVLSNGGRFATAAPESDPAQTIPAAGVFFAAASLALIALIIHWAVTKKPLAARGFGLYTVIFAVPSLVGINRMGEQQATDGYQLWSIPVLVAAVLGGVLGVLFVIDRIRRGLRRASLPARAVGELSDEQTGLIEARRRRIAELSESEREAVRLDLESAINDLERRGVITAADAERARAAELGALALLMSPATVAAMPARR